ncbi:hypothetical protein GCM10010191_81930 [Actinomadura vinacea]|uniref:Uncharacterized protein n=1 Tax=Actinomadura vinacea TaxID=115336 RepID=A0ABN3K747_9ACTN
MSVNQSSVLMPGTVVRDHEMLVSDEAAGGFGERFVDVGSGFAHIAGVGDDLIEGGDAQDNRGPLAFLLCVELSEFAIGAGEVDPQSLNLTEPSLHVRLRR